MRFLRRIGGAVSVVGVTLIATACPNEPCVGEPGEDYVAGQVVVLFASSIDDAVEGEAFLVEQGLPLFDVIKDQPGDVVIVGATPEGEECSWVQRLSEEPQVDTATLRYLYRAD